MKATIICIGDEVLCGDTLNSNATFLAKELSDIGIEVIKHIVVSDDEEMMRNGVLDAINISDVILTTGGLGPTMDDMTKVVVSDVFDLPLEQNIEALAVLEKFFKTSKHKITPNNYTQSLIPKGAKVLSNDLGTAPGVLIEKDKKIAIMFPGPPREMKHMYKTHIKNFLEHKLNKFFVTRSYMTSGIGESQIEYLLRQKLPNIDGVSVNTYFNQSGVMLKTVSKANNEEKAKENLETIDKIIIDNFSEHIYSNNGESLEEVLIRIIKEKNLTLSFAESCTGGLLSSLITKYPGVSDIFMGSVVCYSNLVKEKVLSVKKETLINQGAVSKECADELAINVAKLLSSDISVAITGIAGPTGGSEEKPVGLVYISYYIKGKVFSEEYKISGNDRNRIQSRAAYSALNSLRNFIVKTID